MVETKSRRAAWLLLLLLAVCPCPEGWAGTLRVGLVDSKDSLTKRADLAQALGKLGVRGRGVSLRRSFDPGQQDVLVVGAFATSDRGVRRFLSDNAGALRRFVEAGGVIVELAQFHADEKSPSWLPDGLSARRGERDGVTLAAAGSTLPLLTQPNKLNLGTLARTEVLENRKTYATGVLGTTDLFVEMSGFEVVATDGSSAGVPAILVGRSGKGLVVLVALAPDDCSAMAGDVEQEKESLALLKNLVAMAEKHREAPLVVKGTSFQSRAQKHRILVFVDKNGNGRQDPEDRPASGVVVHVGLTEVTTNADGAAIAEIPLEKVVNVTPRLRDGHRWSTPWTALSDEGTNHTFGMTAIPGGPTPQGRIWQFTDTHLGLHNLEEDARVLAKLRQDLRGRIGEQDLVVVTGDVTHRGRREQLELFAETLKGFGGSVMPVMGNHDQGSGPQVGRFFQRWVGPLQYSWEWNGKLVVAVLKPEMEGEEGLWLKRQVETAGRPVVILCHYYPRSDVLQSFPSGKVSAVVSGHWHGDQVVPSAGTISVNSPPSLVGSWDFSPAGVRVIRFDPVEGVGTSFVPRVVQPQLAVSVAKDGTVVVGDVTLDETPPVCILNGRELPLVQQTPFGWVGELGKAGSADKGLTLQCTHGERKVVWTSSQKGRASLAWARPLPGRVHLASPVVQGDRVFVPLRDVQMSGENGAIVAMDAGDGETLWTRFLATHPSSTPVVSGQVLVVSEVSGRVSGISLDSGEVMWTTDVGKTLEVRYASHYLHVPGLLRRGVVYYCYQEGAFGIRAKDGAVVWHSDKWGNADAFHQSRGVFSGDDLYCAGFSGGLYKMQPLSGSRTVRMVGKGLRSVANLVQRDGLWILTPRSVVRFDVENDRTVKESRLHWSYTPMEPGIGENRLLLPFGQRGVAVHDGSGARRKAVTMEDGALVFSLDQLSSGTPVGNGVTVGGRWWVPGVDGKLWSVDPESGAGSVLMEVAVPLTSSPVVWKKGVIVADWSGMVYGISTRR